MGYESWPGVARIIVNQDHKVPEGQLRIAINLDEVNSIGEVKEIVLRMIDKEWKKYREGKPSKRMIDYDLALQVGDKKREGLTNEQIAREIFPRDFKEDNEKAKPESAIRKISNYYQSYEKLVNGGHRELKFP